MIETIINELQNIANAFDSVETFIFEEISEINDDVSKSYPAILVNSRDVNFTNASFNNSYLPREKNYTLQIFFFDLFKESEQAVKTKQAKYGELELIADQYLAELKRRTVDEYQNFDFSVNANGFEVDKVHNDNLVQIVYTVNFVAKQNCSTGTFVYV